MSRAWLFAGGVLLLAVSVGLTPSSTGGEGGVTAALGRSMGGLRVMVIDGCFLRAEALRKSGRIEDAAALYQTVLDLDPVNEAASAFLAETYVQELMPQVADLQERFTWWDQARQLLEAALARRPDAFELHARLASLLLDPTLADPALAPLIEARVGGAQRLALRHLARAVRGTETLPRLGRSHLMRAALLAPLEAARALAAGDDEDLAWTRKFAADMLAQRGGVLGDLRLEAGQATSLRTLLQVGMAAVEAVAAARRGRGTVAEAKRGIAAYDALVPGSGLVPALRLLLDKPR